MYLLDTNICIFAIQRKPENVFRRLYEFLKDGIYISVLTVAELEFGVANSSFPEKNRIALLEFLSIFNILSFDDKDAIQYGLIKSKLRKSGNIISPIDILLAAQAVSKELILVTNNVREFQRVETIRIEDWTK